MGIKNLLNKVLYNKYVLYILLAWSLFTVLTVQVLHLAWFLVIAAATFYFVSRNMVIVLAVPILAIHLLTAHHFLERMTTKDEADGKSKGTDDKTKGTDDKTKTSAASAGKQQEKPSTTHSNKSGQGINAAPLDGTSDADKVEAAIETKVEDTIASAEKGMADMTEAYTNLGGTWATEIQQHSQSLMRALNNFSPSMAGVKL